MDLLIAVGCVFFGLIVYRICKVCWRQTKHDVFDHYGEKVYRCKDCGTSYRSEK